MAKSEVPEWWNLNSYAFLNEAPLDAWAWEFFRRYKLVQGYAGQRPVDAMNPAERDVWHRPWPERSGKGFTPASAVPSVLCRNLPDHDIPFKIYKNLWIELRLDLSRSDQELKDHFERTLAQIRQKLDKKGPPRINPRLKDWSENRILETWDLRQFKVSWSSIAETLDLNSPQSARNAYNTAHRLIDLKGWKRLSR